jgi:TrmH RNA methyltransferase
MDDEVRVCGINAVRAMFERRSQDIVRVYLTDDRIPLLSGLLKYCAAEHKAYHLVAPQELERVAGSVHHEGVCIIAKRKRALTFLELVSELKQSDRPTSLVMLEGVENPHNVGAILRVAANFGVRALLTEDHRDAPSLSAAVLRTAEGGAEAVDLVRVESTERALAALVEIGFRIYATSGRGRSSIYREHIAPRALFVFGSEGRGLSKRLLGGAHEVVAIPGTGSVESLNVACASAIILGEYWRAHSDRPPSLSRKRSRGGDRALRARPRKGRRRRSG